jgi:hypothetical protein
MVMGPDTTTVVAVGVNVGVAVGIAETGATRVLVQARGKIKTTNDNKKR